MSHPSAGTQRTLPSDIVLIGAGGHAKVCIEILRAMGETVGFCIGNGDASCLGVPVLQGDAHLAELAARGYSRAFVAIGANAVRTRLAHLASSHGFVLVSAIHPHATVSPSARIGHGVAVMAGVVINAEATIGDLCIVNTGATVDHDCVLGEAVHIAPQCGLAGNVRVGRQTFLGIGCKVIPEMTIGEAVVLGAGSVVVRDIGSGQRAWGSPARTQPS